MIDWTFYSYKKPPVNKKILIARHDFGYGLHQYFDIYFGKLIHPFSDSQRYNPDWYHWVVTIDDKEQIFEIGVDDAWTEINYPELSICRG